MQSDDVRLAWWFLLRPWKWKRGKAVEQLEEDFKKYLGVNYAYSFNSGRSSLYAILKALDLPADSKVAMQAFTCNAVPNPILWAGLTPVYVDCGNDFNMDFSKIADTPITASALVVQHTFGLPANMDKAMAIGKARNMPIIEDCAHALGAEYHGKRLGTFGDAAFFSFARDKVISCVYGGMAVTNDDAIGGRLAELQKEFGRPSLFWICQQLLHPLLLRYVILPSYDFFDVGKLFLILSQWLRVLSKAVSWQEKRGLKPEYFPRALPNALAELALHQLQKLDAFNAHRKKIAEFYYQELRDTRFILPRREGNIFLRFAVRHPKAHEIIYQAWHKENMLLGDWYTAPIAPADTDLEEMKYRAGTCPNAEKLSRETINLPTHINILPEQAGRIAAFLQQWK